MSHKLFSFFRDGFPGHARQARCYCFADDQGVRLGAEFAASVPSAEQPHRDGLRGGQQARRPRSTDPDGRQTWLPVRRRDGAAHLRALPNCPRVRRPPTADKVS